MYIKTETKTVRFPVYETGDKVMTSSNRSDLKAGIATVLYHFIYEPFTEYDDIGFLEVFDIDGNKETHVGDGYIVNADMLGVIIESNGFKFFITYWDLWTAIHDQFEGEENSYYDKASKGWVFINRFKDAVNKPSFEYKGLGFQVVDVYVSIEKVIESGSVPPYESLDEVVGSLKG